MSQNVAVGIHLIFSSRLDCTTAAAAEFVCVSSLKLALKPLSERTFMQKS